MRRGHSWAGIAFAAMLVAVAAVISGCGSDSGTGSTTGSTAKAKPGGTLKVSVLSDPLTLAPASELEAAALEVGTQICETLFRVDTNGKLIPQLATSFKASPDGLTYTIQIRKGVKFSNGKTLTSKDVAFSLEEARHSLYYSGLYEPIAKVEAPSPSTVVVKTKEPMAALKADLSILTSGIVPDNYGGVSEKEFGQHPIGTGPFELKSWAHGESVTLTRNPDYWQPNQPLLDSVVFQVVPDGNSRVSQLQGGNSNVIITPPIASLPSLEATPGLGVIETPQASVYLLLLNVKNPLFKSPRIREAINVAIDREGINEAALGGRGQLGGSYLAPNLAPFWDGSIKAPTQNVAKAKELVAEAVKDEGVNPSFTLIFWTNETYPSTASQVMQQNLNEVGFNVKLQPLDISAALASVEGSEFDAAIDGYFSVSPDPSENVQYYLGSFAEPSGAETKKYSELAESAASELNIERRKELYVQLQELVAEQENGIVLGYQPNFWALQDSVVGFEVSPLNVIWLANTGFSS